MQLKIVHCEERTSGFEFKGLIMVSDVVRRTRLWNVSLGAHQDSSNEQAVEKLRSALSEMRSNASHLASRIHTDVVGLTVHDETHFDALWETANAIAGDDFTLNPVEGFVFGAAILLHDTALSIAAYPGGLSELGETVEWRDIATLLADGKHNSNDPLYLKANDGSLFQKILFNVLRLLHARQAEQLVTRSFSRPGESERLYILGDASIRDAYGASIGRIAHSHHWNVSELTQRLQTTIGSMPGLSPDWTLNEVKVSCLLRCADASHIDARRAPTFLYTIYSIDGVSREHWSFQNKLNQVTRVGEKLVFSSGRPFLDNEASSWWLAHDTLKMIDGEIKKCNAVLPDIGVRPFAAKSVAGIESPELLSRHLRVSGWIPVDAEVRVSDPVRLARTLGGENLYGSGPVAPIRELLQNAVDAVRLRRLQENREIGWGKVALSFERTAPSSDDVWLHVDDNGVGMSGAVLTGPLIDFGSTLVSSGMLEHEFPGLQSRRPIIIGKFGIGFFAVFLLGSYVKVVTKKYNSAESDTKVLVFDDLSRRPFIRNAAAGELPIDVSTRVSIKLSKDTTQKLYGIRSAKGGGSPIESVLSHIVSVISAVDVDIDIVDSTTGFRHSHGWNWWSTDSKVFLSELLHYKGEKLAEIVEKHKDLLRVILDENGVVLGRACLNVVSDRLSSTELAIEVEGFVSPLRDFSSTVEGNISEIEDDYEEAQYIYSRARSRRFSNCVGVLKGYTSDASRKSSGTIVPPDLIAKWVSDQARELPLHRFTKTELNRFCFKVLELGGDSGDLPFVFLGGQFVSRRRFVDVVVGLAEIHIVMIRATSSSDVRAATLSEFGNTALISQVRPDIMLAPQDDVFNRVIAMAFSKTDREEIIKSARFDVLGKPAALLNRVDYFHIVMEALREVWGSRLCMYFQYCIIRDADLLNDPGASLCLTIGRAVQSSGNQ